jgi:hypothetical protein
MKKKGGGKLQFVTLPLFYMDRNNLEDNPKREQYINLAI